MKIVSLITLSFLLAICANAQTFTNYTVDSGLVNDNVICSDVATSDVLWFGTQEGISVYDGTTWTTYTTTTDSGLAHNTIQAISVMSNGDVWIGTDFGASIYDGTSWTAYDESDGLGDNRVKHIAEDSNGDVWFGTNDGVTKLSGSTWTSWGIAEGLPFGGVTYVDFDSNGDKLLGSGLGGLAVFDDVSFMLVTEAERLLSNKIRAIGIDGGGNKWIGTADGVSVFNPDGYLVEQHTIMLTLPAPDTLNPIEDMKIAGTGNIWTGIYVDYLVTEGGVAMFNGDIWASYDVSNGLAGPAVSSISIDSQDNIWVTTSTGISKISNIPADTIDYWATWDNDPAYPEDTITISIPAAEGLSSGLSIYPIPARSAITITADAAIDRVEIISIQGAILRTLNSEGQSSINLTLDDIVAGFYVARIYSQGESEVLRFVKE